MIKDFIKGIFTGNTIDKTIDIIEKRVPDRDKQNEMIRDVMVARESNKTNPILDGIHKLGRQILIGVVVVFHIYTILNDIDISLEELGFLYGAVSLYTALKGKGR